jgi:hypothetical protein
MCRFAIVNADTGEPLGIEYDSPQQAQEVSRQLNDEHRERGSEFRTRIKKVEAEYTRAQVTEKALRAGWFVRDDSGRSRGPFAQYGWWRVIQQDNPHHVAHGSFSDPERVRFYSTVEALMEGGKRSTLSVGGYLNRYAVDGNGERLYDDRQTQKLVLEWSNHFANRVLHMVTDGAAIAAAYQRGPRSCMRYEGDSYEGDEHPCTVYGYGDIGLAYFTADDDPDSDLKARALINLHDRSYSRVYGDDSRMIRLLEDQGYESGSLEGCRIAKVPDGDGYIMPYIDGAYAVTDAGSHFVIDSCGEVSADSTGGLSYDRTRECSHCGYDMGEDEQRTAYDDGNVYCSSCIQWCGDCGEDHSPDYEFCWISDIHESVCSDCAHQNHHQCESCGEFRSDDYVVDEQGCTYCLDCSEEHTCVDCGVVDSCNVNDEHDSGDYLCDTCQAERDEDGDEEEDEDA